MACRREEGKVWRQISGGSCLDADPDRAGAVPGGGLERRLWLRSAVIRVGWSSVQVSRAECNLLSQPRPGTTVKIWGGSSGVDRRRWGRTVTVVMA